MKLGMGEWAAGALLGALAATYGAVPLGPPPPPGLVQTATPTQPAAAVQPTASAQPVAAAQPVAMAEPEPERAGLTYGVDVTLLSDYVRRGERLGSSGLSAHAGFERRLASGLALRGHVQSFIQFAGADVGEAIYDMGMVSPTQKWMGGRLVAGWTYYDRNRKPLSKAFMGHDTQEVYFGAEFDYVGHPWALLRYDYDAGDGRHNSQPGTYLCAGAGHTWRLTQDLDASIDGRLGLDFGRGIDGFSDALVQTSLALHVARGVTVSPRVDWWMPSHQLWPQAHGFRPTAALTVAYNASF